MSAAEIFRTTPAPRESARLWGSSVDAPREGTRPEGYFLVVEGWALARDAPAQGVEVVHEGRVVAQAPIWLPRGDIMRLHPDIPGAERSGFRAVVNLLRVAPEFTLDVVVVLPDGCRVRLAAIAGRRPPLRRATGPDRRPLMVTTLGRTGSTWLVRLLEQHPGVVAYRPFFYEPRVASYWMGVLKTLSDPASYLQGLLPDLSRRQQSVAFPEGTASYLQGLRPDLSPAPWWTGENRPSPLPPLPPEPDLRGWLGGDHVESLAAFCCGRIDAFYEQVAAALGRPGAPYFVEKVFPDRFILPALHELYPGAKEILLVRDFRDMVCSIAAFTAKRGYAAFGRQHARDEAEHIRNLRGRAVCMLESWQRRSDRAFLLHYEDLIERPEETLGAALRYLGLDDDPGLVERMIRQATELRPDVQKDHQTSAGPRESVGRWRRDLSPALLAVCQESFGDVLRAFGYEDAAERPAPDTYEDLPRELRDALRGVVPLSATVAVVSKGDDQLLDLDGRPCRHFPEVDGIYAGYAPADSAEAIAWLEAAREAGVEYLVFPWTALWWLEYYDGLARHLEANYRAVRRDRVCAVFALARGEAPDKPGARATGGPRTGA